MKKLNNLKVGVFFTLLLFIITSLQATSNSKYILNDDGLIDPRAIIKINEIGDELQAKTGVKIYVYIKDSYGINDNLTMKEKIEKTKKYEEDIVKKLSIPYVLLTMSVAQTHVNLFTSQDLKTVIDKDEILDDYVIPLLASKDKNKLYSKISAAILNGYAQTADEIAKSKGLKLESSIGSSGKTFGTIWKVFIYFVIVTGIGAYTVAVLRARKKS